MSVVLRLDGFKFFFYSNEESNLPESAHIHVFKAGAEAKFWLAPNAQLTRNEGFDAKTLRKITAMVANHRA